MQSAESDSALVASSRGGDRTAFACIVERYQRTVYAIAFGTVRDHALAEDITQDAFVAAWCQLDTLRDPLRLPAWLCGIARNLARNANRRHHRERSSGMPAIVQPQTALDTLVDAETERALVAALASIPEAYREPLVMFYFEQRSVAAVARALGLTPGTTNKRLSRGRRYLGERVTALAETARRRRDVVVGVLAAIVGLGVGSPVSASTLATKGSTMVGKLAIATALTTAVVGAGLLSADTRPVRAPAPATSTPPTRTAKPAMKSRQANRVVPARPSPAPQLATKTSAIHVPDCDEVAQHMATLELERIAPKRLPQRKRDDLAEHISSTVASRCEREQWSENRRLCVTETDGVERARIDCSDEPVPTAQELAALTPNLQCAPLAQHVYAVAIADGHKRVQAKQGDPADWTTAIERLAAAGRNEVTTECGERPWSVDKRRCVAAATTLAALTSCGLL